MREKYQVRFINNKEDSKLYEVFTEVLNIDYKDKEVDTVDMMLSKDVINIIDRLDVNTCKKYLGRVGIKGYYNLNKADTVKLLKEQLRSNREQITLDLYNENKVKLDMYAYEVVEALNISRWRFNQIKDSLLISGTQVVNIGGKPKTVNKYDRKFIYKLNIK